MEKRQLDLNRPLLSVRRIPKLGYRSAMSCEVVNERPRLTPPPCHYSEQVTKPAAVPFVWEHIPGRAKSKSGPLYFARDEHGQQQAAASPRFQPGPISLQGQKKELDEVYVQKAQARAPSPIVRACTMFERSDEDVYEKESALYPDGNDECADALDALLPEEAFSMNCGVSGLSGEEGPNSASSRNFSANKQALDFLMSRFLPAAKAMALESPQYAVKKRPVPVEEPKQAKRLLNIERRPHPQLKQCESSVEPRLGRDLADNQRESDDESCDAPSGVSVRACGFLPRFCLKNSLAVISQATDVRGGSPSPRVPGSEGRKVPKSPSTRLTLPDKHAWEASHRRILEHKAEWPKLNEASIDRQIKEYLKSKAAQESHRVSPHRSISPYRNQRPPSPFREGVGFLGIPKESEKPKACTDSIFDNGATSDEFHDVVSPVEKTLYIDFINHVNKSDNSPEEVVKREVVDPLESAKKKAIGPESIPHVMQRLKEFSFSKREAADSFLPTRPALSRDPKIRNPGLDRKSGSFVKASVEDMSVAKKESTKEYDETTNLALAALPLPPPLPKVPSESWLWRTLPSIPSKNPFSGLKTSSSRPSSPSAKWETIVKSSKLHNDHKRYSQELSTDVLRQYIK